MDQYIRMRISQGQDITFNEDLIVDLNKIITFMGGYACDYTSITGKTTISGNMTISKGELIIENGTVEVI